MINHGIVGLIHLSVGAEHTYVFPNINLDTSNDAKADRYFVGQKREKSSHFLLSDTTYDVHNHMQYV